MTIIYLDYEKRVLNFYFQLTLFGQRAVLDAIVTQFQIQFQFMPF